MWTYKCSHAWKEILLSDYYIYTSNEEGNQNVITKTHFKQKQLICRNNKYKRAVDQLHLKAVRGHADDLWLHSVPVAAEEPGCPPVAVALRQQHIQHRVDTRVQVLQHRTDEVKHLPGLSVAIPPQVQTQLQHITRQPAHREGSSGQEHHDGGTAGVPGAGHRHYRALVEKKSQADVVEGDD